eukprot:1891918-Alexandrium_andersonii.AAC.2
METTLASRHASAMRAWELVPAPSGQHIQVHTLIRIEQGCTTGLTLKYPNRMDRCAGFEWACVK